MAAIPRRSLAMPMPSIALATPPAPAAADPAAAADSRPTKRPRTEGIPVPNGICAFHHIEDWIEEHKGDFAPPVCNRLMHRGQLSIMFVGSPNTRTDFHLEEGSEFFLQLKGNIELPTIQKGKRKLVKINEGQVFCLPSRIPHSPQRPNPGSVGLVVERRREAKEVDGLIFYTDFNTCEKVEWEQFFKCNDLRQDLPPVIENYKKWKASQASKQPRDWPEKDRPVRQNKVSEVPPPFSLQDFLLANADKLASGEVIPLMGRDHPDKEVKAFVAGGPSQQRGQKTQIETFLYQLKGTAYIAVQSGTLALTEGCCCIVLPGIPYEVSRTSGSIGLVLQQDPKGNIGLGQELEEEADPSGSGGLPSGSGDGPPGGAGPGAFSLLGAAAAASSQPTQPTQADDSEEENSDADEDDE